MEGFLKLSTATNVTVLMIDSADHITGKTGLSAGLTIYATKAAGAPAAITPTVTELDATNVKGLYKLALTTGHTDTLGELQIHVTATGADPTDVKWQISTYLPGEAATLQADQAVNTTKFGGTTVTGRDIGASVLLSSGAGTGQLDFTSGVVKANATQWLGGTIPAVNVTGVPLVDLKYTLGTISPATAGSVRADSVTGAVGSVTGAVGSVTGNVGGNVVGSVASVTARVTANTDQLAGQTVTAAAGVTFPTSVASPTNITAGTITTATNLTNAPTAGDFTAAMKTSLNAATPAVTVSDKTGFSLTAAYDPAKTASQAGDAMALTSGERTTLAAAIWNALTSGLTTVASIGKLLVDNINATISSRLPTSSYTAPLDAGGTRSALGMASANLDTQLDALPTAAENAVAVWDEALSGHTTSGTAGATLTTAGTAGDPWAVALPGAYSAGTAGKIVGDNVNATISSRLPTASYTVPDNADIAAIKAKTDNLPPDPADASDIAAAFATVNGNVAVVDGHVLAVKAKTDNLPPAPAAVGDIPTAAQNADKLLGRAIAGGADGGHTVQDALKPLRNRTEIVGSDLNVYEEDGATLAWTAPISRAPGDPLSSIDPA